MTIEEIKKEYEDLLTQLSDPELVSNWEKFDALMKRRVHLEKIIAKAEEIQDLKKKIEENKIIISAKEDPELVSLAEAEIGQLKERGEILEEELSSLLGETGTGKGRREGNSSRSVIIEIRAGTGGEEAALFAADLFKMYSKYAFFQGWKEKILDSRPTELGGFKEIVFELTPHQDPGKGGDIFSKMKYEGGVHRVQRIPETEKTGRIHTSTVSVAVLPKPKKAEIKINPQDLKIDSYKASGPGGQYVNKRMTAVRISHLPTGIIVTSQTERSLQQNKENAMSILEALLLEKREAIEEEKTSGKRKAQIGQAKRAEKIRTYNFPQDRVTDHRIKKSFHNLDQIMEGKLDKIIESF